MSITDGIIEGILLKAGDLIFMASHGVAKKYVLALGALIVKAVTENSDEL